MSISKFSDYYKYHCDSYAIGDIDPSFKMLRYLCDRFELNIEQRCWLAYLYGLTYCGASVFYIYNEFPDFENVDVGRLERWWNKNKQHVLFQTDRMRIKTSNQVVPSFLSYKELVGSGTQSGLIYSLAQSNNPFENYEKVYSKLSNIKYFGRFSMFNYLEALQVTTGLNIEPTDLDMREAESCRNGVCFAVNDVDLINHFDKRNLSREEIVRTQKNFRMIVDSIKNANPSHTIWNIETTLCAYKKYKVGKRYVGFYLDRQKEEIEHHSKNPALAGCDWSVLWQFRKETFNKKYLGEFK